jgi:hypothetical protein
VQKKSQKAAATSTTPCAERCRVLAVAVRSGNRQAAAAAAECLLQEDEHVR